MRRPPGRPSTGNGRGTCCSESSPRDCGAWWARRSHWFRQRSWLTATAWLSAWVCVGGIVVVLTQVGTQTGALGGRRPAEEFPFLAPLATTRGPAADRTPPTPSATATAADVSPTTTSPSSTATPTANPTAPVTPAAARTTTPPPRTTSRPTRTKPAPRPSPPRPPTRTAVTPDATEPAPQLDPRFPNCAQARANGYGPYRRDTDPEYQWYPDKDGDGLACERGRRDA